MSLESVFVVLAAVMFFLLAGYVGWALAVHGRHGGATDFAREYLHIVRLHRTLGESRQLCHRALLEVPGTRTSDLDDGDQFEAWSSLDGVMSGRHRLRLTLRPHGPQTTVTVSSRGVAGLTTRGFVDPRTTEERRRQVDQLAAWLAKHGDGHTLDKRSGEIVWF